MIQVFRWFKAFSEGRESIEDEPHSERPSISKTAENVVRVRDLVRSDRRLTNHLKGHHFGTLENIQTAVTDQLKAIPISEFHQCYEEWKKRLQRCLVSEGSYFEGDNVELRMQKVPVAEWSCSRDHMQYCEDSESNPIATENPLCMGSDAHSTYRFSMTSHFCGKEVMNSGVGDVSIVVLVTQPRCKIRGSSIISTLKST
ncbi:putative transposase [Trichonephila clavipes]|nr:putative transposase [Trichonephila clavipes]